MAASNVPTFAKTPTIAWGTITAANTNRDGTGTVTTVFTAGADGAIVQRIRASSLGTNVVSVLRLFINNGSTNATAGNNTLIAEMTLPATTATEVAGLLTIDIPLNMPLPAGYKINAVIGTAVSAGWAVAGIGGSF